MTRSESTDSGHSPNLVRNASSSSTSAASILTPPTSNTDAASVSTDATVKPETSRRTSERLREVRSSTGSYNENVLSGSAQRATRRKVQGGDSLSVFGESLFNGNSAQAQLICESVQLLDRDWTLGAMPGDSLNISPEKGGGARRRQSTRLDILQKASTMVEKTRSVLGKRGRDTVEAGMEKLHALKRNTTDGLRPRGVKTPTSEGSPRKRARFSEVAEPSSVFSSHLERKLARRARAKHWLGQGLYLGQDRDFDPKLTETKNKLKKASGRPSNIQQRRILPLPMFAGERTLQVGRNFRLPFDVFSPLPPGQPKPEEWKKTHKNVFIGDAASVWKKSKPLESSTCICNPESRCDEDCFNRFMFYECDGTNCNLGADHCTNRSFEGLRQRTKAGGKYNVGVEVIKTLDRGHGVRSNRTFDPNQIIVEYTGEIITQDECDDRMHRRYKDAECYYLMDFDQHMILDATRGSIARFINHSCEPNCKMIKWTVGGKPRMALFAGDKGITTGEELTYDYNFNPYSIKNVQACRCGAASCRGVLGPRPKEVKDALKPLITSGKRGFQQALEDTVAKVTKKRKMAIPSSVKTVFAEAKAQTSVKIAKARILGASTTSTNRLAKKASERSLRGLRRMTVSESTANKVKKHTTITYSRRRSSTGTFVKGKPVDEMQTSPKEGKVERPVSRKNNGKAAASSVTQNVVRTVRRSEREHGGKTIRVIGSELE